MIIGVGIGGSFTKAVALCGVSRALIITTEPTEAVSGVLEKILTKENSFT